MKSHLVHYSNESPKATSFPTPQELPLLWDSPKNSDFLNLKGMSLGGPHCSHAPACPKVSLLNVGPAQSAVYNVYHRSDALTERAPHNLALYWLSHAKTLFSRARTKVALAVKMEKAMAPHSSTLAWKIPWTEEPGGLQSMGSLGVRHDWVTSLSLFTFMHWRRKWQPTPVFLPG